VARPGAAMFCSSVMPPWLGQARLHTAPLPLHAYCGVVGLAGFRLSSVPTGPHVALSACWFVNAVFLTRLFSALFSFLAY
jgi:hypothetical protein